MTETADADGTPRDQASDATTDDSLSDDATTTEEAGSDDAGADEAGSDEAGAEETPLPVISAPSRLFVGGYSAEMGGSAVGLAMYTGSDGDTGAEFSDPAHLELGSPSYLIKHPDRDVLYVVHEASPGKVSAISYDQSGLHLINTVESGGDGGCHLCFDHSGDFVVVAHYASGSIASFKIEENGGLSDRVSLLQFSGSGADPERQEASHAHQVVSVGSSILVPDLGTDSVHIVRIDGEGELSPAGDSITLPPGSGPRHLVLSGRHLVVACELSAQLWVSALDAEVGSEGVTVPTSTRATEERIYPSAIAQYGEQIVVANRGADTISVFTLDASGTPHPLVEVDCGGAWPRDLTVADDQLWIANQAQNTVSVIEPRSRSNKPEDWPVLLQLPTPSPACVVPVDQE